MDLHEEAERLAAGYAAEARWAKEEKRSGAERAQIAATTLRALSARLAEVEKERDEWVAEAQHLSRVRDELRAALDEAERQGFTRYKNHNAENGET